jgi:hypothetical protein
MRHMYKDSSQRRGLIVGVAAILILGAIFWVTYRMTDFVFRVVHASAHILGER